MVILNSLLHGFLMGLSLILPIGAQNTFVLKQGLKKQYVFWVCLVCAVSDAILILAGVMGFGALILQHPMMTEIAKIVGAVFLFAYGALHIKSAFKNAARFDIYLAQDISLTKTLGLCLAFTWLNPHVYLDTVVLLGSISVQFAQDKLYFALGAITASFSFFYILGYASRLLLPVFKTPRAWQVLDVLIAYVMWWIALSLIL